MGYTLVVLRIDFQQLLSVPGSRNSVLLAQALKLVDYLPYDLEPDDDEPEEDAPLSPEAALRRIFDGSACGDHSNYDDYSMAMMVLYRRLGQVVGQIAFSSRELVLLHQWGDAMRAAGFKHGVDDLAYRGAPFDVATSGDFPAIGYLTPDEIAATMTLFEGRIAWPKFWSRVRPKPDMDGDTLKQFHSWMAATATGEGLVGVLS